MTEAWITQLAQMGGMGIALAAMLGVFWWTLKKLIATFLDQSRELTSFMSGSTHAMQKIIDNLDRMDRRLNEQSMDSRMFADRIRDYIATSDKDRALLSQSMIQVARDLREVRERTMTPVQGVKPYKP